MGINFRTSGVQFGTFNIGNSNEKNHTTERKLSKPNFLFFSTDYIFMEFKFEWLLVGGNGLVVMVEVDQEGRGEKKSTHGRHHRRKKPE